MNTKIVIVIKLLLFLVYAVIAFLGLFVVFFMDSPDLRQSFFVQFLLPLYFFFIVAAIASFFLPLKYSFIAPVVILILFLVFGHLTTKELEKIKKGQSTYINTSE